jgi:hypothetical protein
MDRSGPEKLYKTDLMLRQILQVLGELTPDNEAIIDQMCRLSMASMDIESRTVQVDLRHPEVFTVLTEKNDGPSLMGCQAHVKKIQKPIMIAHQDELTEGVIHFTAENDSEEAIYSMMSKYWAQVMACQMECQEKKRQLAKTVCFSWAKIFCNVRCCSSRQIPPLQAARRPPTTTTAKKKQTGPSSSCFLRNNTWPTFGKNLCPDGCLIGFPDSWRSITSSAFTGVCKKTFFFFLV